MQQLSVATNENAPYMSGVKRYMNDKTQAIDGIDGQSDLGIGDLSILDSRLEAVTYSYTHYTSSYTFTTPVYQSIHLYGQVAYPSKQQPIETIDELFTAQINGQIDLILNEKNPYVPTIRRIYIKISDKNSSKNL
ncbi:unnamed protein product [Medioppia subpectinata]|uniref:Uncharacterized protein n=1 Tax=Medioppia subpectinata TaxID=1979941 RepID=A0A7R9KNG2_9ACAR|nr:unnamed protein product [Medioppia subpectinata]CAG2106480.1 unnamed protein product [Medioppia subpectinata]